MFDLHLRFDATRFNIATVEEVIAKRSHIATTFRPKLDGQTAKGGKLMKRKNLADDWCPVARTLDSVGDWWSLLLVRDAVMFGKRRFGEFQKSLGLARNILTARLRKLVSHGVLELVPASDGSAYQEYVPTERGRGLYVVLTALRQWGERSFEPGEMSTVLVDTEHGEAVRPLELRARDGRLLGPGDIRVIPATHARSSNQHGRKRRAASRS